jgi:hypothetical protein
MDNEIVPDQNRRMPLARRGFRTAGFWPEPSHDLQVKNMKIVKILFAVPTAENEHLCTLNKVRCVTVSPNWSSSPFWPLIPSHGHWV